MSSTWFNEVTAVRNSKIHFSEYEYILFANCAESNCFDLNGKHFYEKRIIGWGTYDQILRQIYSFAYEFDIGLSYWKPNRKDGCGFVKMCKKALNEAIVSDKMSLNGKIYVSKNYEWLFDVFKDKFSKYENWRIVNQGQDKYFETDNIDAYIHFRMLITRIMQDFQMEVENQTTLTVQDFYNQHEDWYKNY